MARRRPRTADRLRGHAVYSRWLCFNQNAAIVPRTTAYPLLFSPFLLGNLSLPNRIVMAPMSSSLAGLDGHVTHELIAFLRDRAAGGCGLVIVEFTCVEPRFGLGELRQPRIDLDEHIASHAGLVKAITGEGARACLQLHLPGQYVARDSLRGAQAVAPSEVIARDGRQLARALESDEIEQLVQRFAEGAQRAVQAGYQAIELHGAHGYLPMAFMSPRKNVRTDAWGGDFQKRLAFPLAVVRALRKAMGPHMPLIYRLSADEFAKSGLTLADMERVAPQLAAAGCTALHVSTGTVEGAMDRIVDPMSMPVGWRFPLARRLREASGLPVIGVGPVRWPQSAEAALAAGDADLIGLGRPLLADPAWANKARDGRLADITPCTSCNWCMDRVRQHAAIGCAENPRTGREMQPEMLPDAQAGSVAVVVGAGPGGLQAALDLDACGYRTHLFEARSGLGGGLDVSAAPPFKDSLNWYGDHLRHRVAQSRVAVHTGQVVAAQDIIAMRPSLAVLATGSSAKPWRASFGRATLQLLDATDVLLGDETVAAGSGLVVVYGGGETGCETAEFLAARGFSVVLATRSGASELARAAEPMYRRQLRGRLTNNPAIEILPQATLIDIQGSSLVFELGHEARAVEARALVMAQGRDSANGMAADLTVAGIPFALVGDAKVIGRIGDAVHDARRAVRKLTKQAV